MLDNSNYSSQWMSVKNYIFKYELIKNNIVQLHLLFRRSERHLNSNQFGDVNFKVFIVSAFHTFTEHVITVLLLTNIDVLVVPMLQNIN